MKDLSFLKKATVAKVEAPTRSSGGGSTLVKQPSEGAHLRVFKNGRVYPSEKFAEDFALHYLPKTETPDPITGALTVTVEGNGLDIFNSKDWTQVQGLEEELLFISAIRRQEKPGKLAPKMDLFGSCQYKENLPVSGIYEQGASTFGKNRLCPMLEEVYGVNWEETKFVDLVIMFDHIMPKSEEDVYQIPKTIQRGKKSGNLEYIRREKLDIYPILVKEVEVKEVEVVDAETVDPNIGEDIIEPAKTEPKEESTPKTSEESPVAPVDAIEPTKDVAPTGTGKEDAPASGGNILDSLL